MDIKTLAFTLLIGRILSVIFNVLVIRRQIKLFKMPVYPSLATTRWVYFGFAVAGLLFSIVPVTIDILTLTSSLTRSSNNVNLVGIFYSVNACLDSLVKSAFIWLLYRLAARTVILVDQDKYEALQKK